LAATRQQVKGRQARKAVQGTLQGWQDYIKHLMGEQQPAATDQHGQWPVAGVPSSNTLNEPFSRQELDAVLQQLKRNKAADLQGLRAEQLKDSYTTPSTPPTATADSTHLAEIHTAYIIIINSRTALSTDHCRHT
jgi:hypothetical protein